MLTANHTCLIDVKIELELIFSLHFGQDIKEEKAMKTSTLSSTEWKLPPHMAFDDVEEIPNQRRVQRETKTHHILVSIDFFLFFHSLLTLLKLRVC